MSQLLGSAKIILESQPEVTIPNYGKINPALALPIIK